MIDNDIFSRTIERRWRRVARSVFAPELTEQACEDAFRVATEDFQQTGFAGLHDLLSTVSRLKSSQRPSVVELLNEIEEIEYRYPNAMTRIAGDVIRRWTVTAPGGEFLEQLDDVGVIGEFLSDLILWKISPAVTLAQLQFSDDWQPGGLEERRNEFRVQVRSSPLMKKLARQLLKDPSGVKVTRPRISKAPVNQQDLLDSFALTTSI